MLHQTVCCFVLSNPSRLCIMGSQWSFFRRRLTPTSRHTDEQTDRQTRSTAPVLSSAASALPQPATSVSIRKHSLSIGAALKLRLSFDLEAGQNANET